MKIQIEAKNFDCGSALQEHIKEEIIERVGKYITTTKLEKGEVNVHLSSERNVFRSLIRTHIGKRILLQAAGENQDVYIAFNEALTHMVKRLRRQIRKLKQHHEKNEIKLDYESYNVNHLVVDPKLDETLPTEETFPTIVAESNYEIQSLNLDEAIMRLDLSSKNFFIFKDLDSKQINLVYFREDGHIGWIKP